MNKQGDLQVWWNPQIGMAESFEVKVSSIEEAAKILNVLAEYDSFQLDNNIKPDYSNMGGLEEWSDDSDGEGTPGWIDWMDEETGEDCPIAYIEYIKQMKGE